MPLRSIDQEKLGVLQKEYDSYNQKGEQLGLRMKSLVITVILLLCFALTQVNATKDKALIQMYFINNKTNNHYNHIERYPYKIMHKTEELYQSIKLKTPLIQTDDIKAYDWNKHCVYLNKKSWDRMQKFMSSRRPRDYETMFIVLLNKRILYYGYILSGYYSITLPIPTITPKYFYKNEPYMPKKMFENRSFLIAYIYMEERQDDPAQRPELYNKLPKGERDPRRNPQLYQALLRTGKIYKGE